MLHKIDLLENEKKVSQLEGVKYAGGGQCNCLCPGYTCGMNCGGLGDTFGEQMSMNAEVNTAGMFYS